jgi:hypothetical protein
VSHKHIIFVVAILPLFNHQFQKAVYLLNRLSALAMALSKMTALPNCSAARTCAAFPVVPASDQSQNRQQIDKKFFHYIV